MKIKVSIFPNPITERLNFKREIKNTHIEIINLQHKIVQTKEAIIPAISISLESLKFGVYIVIIKNTVGQIIASQKIVTD